MAISNLSIIHITYINIFVNLDLNTNSLVVLVIKHLDIQKHYDWGRIPVL